MASSQPGQQPFVFGVDLDSCLGDYDLALKTAIVELREELSTRTGVPLAEFPVDVASFPPNDRWPIWESWTFLRDDLTYQRIHALSVTLGHMFERMPIYDRAHEAIDALLDAGVEIAIVTHRAFIDESRHPDLQGYSAEASAQTINWLRTANVHVGDPRVTFHLSGKKDSVRTDLFVDDSPSNVARLRQAGVPTIIFDQPYNQGLNGLRASSWEDITELVLQRRELVERLSSAQRDLTGYDAPGLDQTKATARRISLPGLERVLDAGRSGPDSAALELSGL